MGNLKFYAFVVIGFVLITTNYGLAQTDSLKNDNGYLKVFLDGLNGYEDFIRVEMGFVNFVRDRAEAEVHLLVTQQATGGGGTEYALNFIGLNQFKGDIDTLYFFSNPNNTEDEIRLALVYRIKMGILQYVAKLSNPPNITISFEIDSLNAQKQEDDKWDSWTFTTSLNANASLQTGQKFLYGNGNFDANRVTDNWKMSYSFGAQYSESSFDFGDGTNFQAILRSQYAEATVVKSINDHWSYGGEANILSSDFSNYKSRISIAPALEYDLFPYKESNSKLLTFFYTFEPSYNQYNDTTIYGLTEQFLLQQSLDVSLNLVQKWGDIYTGIGGSHYFNDINLNQISIFTSLNWNIVNGLSIYGYFSYNIINDQINLEGEGLSQEEILLQTQLRKTDFSFFTYFGISYTFGSIYNNVVNPRFSRNDI